MSRAVISAMLVVLVFAASGVANGTAPDWRGEPNTTYQVWGFPTALNPTPADEGYVNPGTPMATITGMVPGTFWKGEDMGHLGVWRVDQMITLDIPNFPPQNPFKEIILQIIYDGGDQSMPEFYVMPNASSLEKVSSTPVDDYYVHDIYRIIIEPNPPSESILIMPRYCEIYVDEIIVDTRCIPEPASLAMLALGGLMLRRRRR